MSMSFSYFMKPSLKSYGQTKFNDDLFLTWAAGAAFLFSAIAKFGWGALLDVLGFYKVYWAMLITQAIVCFSLDYLASYKFFYLIWIILVFVCEGGHFTIFPPLAS